MQLATILLIIAYTSSRPGAIIESSCAGIRNSNEALPYKDVKVKVLQPEDRSLSSFLIVEITLLFMKGRRGREIP